MGDVFMEQKQKHYESHAGWRVGRDDVHRVAPLIQIKSSRQKSTLHILRSTYKQKDYIIKHIWMVAYGVGEEKENNEWMKKQEPSLVWTRMAGHQDLESLINSESALGFEINKQTKKEIV